MLPTIALLILDSFLGAALLRSQGRAAWRRFNQALAEGRIPAREVFDGAMVILGGAFLITPGFITDVIGLLLLIPPTRAIFRGMVPGWRGAGPPSRSGPSAGATGRRRRSPRRRRARRTTTTRGPPTRWTRRSDELPRRSGDGEPEPRASRSSPGRRPAVRLTWNRDCARARRDVGRRGAFPLERRARASTGSGRGAAARLRGVRGRPSAGGRRDSAAGRRGPRQRVVARSPGRGGRARSPSTEALLSTEYDADGLPQADGAGAVGGRRAPPLRVAADREGEVEVARTMASAARRRRMSLSARRARGAAPTRLLRPG